MTPSRSLPFAFVLALAFAWPALAQTAWGVAATVSNDVVFCDVRRDSVWKLDRNGHLSTVLTGTHCRGLAVSPDGFVYGERVNAGTHMDASSGALRDDSVGIWRVGLSGTPLWVEPPTIAPDPSIWIVIDRDGRSYGWNGALPQTRLSQIVRHEAGSSVVVAGGRWGQRDGTGPAAQFGGVAGLALSPDGTIVVVDSGNVRRVTRSGVVTTESVGSISNPEAGLFGQVGLWDHTIGVAIAADGSAVVVDYPAGRVVSVARDGRATELWRSTGIANWVSGGRWGWRPTGVAILQSGYYVMEDWALPSLAADLVGSPRILLVQNGSSEVVVSISSMFLRVATLLVIIILVSGIRGLRKRAQEA